jgi:hypothetical protein
MLLLGSLGMTSQHAKHVLPLAAPVVADTHAHSATQIAYFTHTIQNKANNIRFAHQSLCSLHISTLLKAIRCGYFKECPNLMAKGVLKYLNPSPATAKGHMKQPRQGIRSTRRCPQDGGPPMPQVRPGVNNNKISIDNKSDDDSADKITFVQPSMNANVIESDNDSIAKVFIFDVFADKRTGFLYSNLTGAFPFMSLEGNVCFLVIYHYKSNSILALPIANFADNTILAAYQQQFEPPKSKGHKFKVNVMDNQASKIIKNYLTIKQCDNLLVKPNNHRVNAAERTIQVFKAHLISALATTNGNFPLQLWDWLTSQMEDTLNMLCPSCINPTMLVYEAVHGPYNWNHFPLAPPGCKAVIYEATES